MKKTIIYFFSVGFSLFGVATVPVHATDETVSGNLTVTGTADFQGNTLTFGAWAGDASQPGVSYFYTDGTTSNISLIATRNLAVWQWWHYSGSQNVLSMALDPNHRLLLYSGTSGTAGITLDPAGASAIGGNLTVSGTDSRLPNQLLLNSSSILTQGLADGLYLTQSTGDSRYVQSGTSILISSAHVGINTGTNTFTSTGAIYADGTTPNLTLIGGNQGHGSMAYKFLVNTSDTAVDSRQTLDLFDKNGAKIAMFGQLGETLFYGSQAFLGVSDRANYTDGSYVGGFYKYSGVLNIWTNYGGQNLMSVTDSGRFAFENTSYGNYGSWNEPNAKVYISGFDDGTPALNVMWGNVGIGTTEPAYTVDVSGSGRFTGPVYLAPQGDLSMGDFTADPSSSQGGGGMEEESMRSSRGESSGSGTFSGTSH